MAADYTIEQLRAEFAAHDLRGFLWPWLHEHLVVIARMRIVSRYSAAVYSPSGVWNDEALNDLAKDFILEQGIDQGAVAQALVRSSDIDALLAYVGVAFCNFIVDRRPRSTERNIFDRLRKTLESSPEFMHLAGLPPHRCFGLAEWRDDPRDPATDVDLESADRFIPEGVKWFTYDSTQRQSPGLSTADLEQTALAVICGIDRLVSAKQLMSVIRKRFVLDATEVEWDDALEELQPHAHTPSPLEHLAACETAATILERLTPRQREILFEQLKKGAEGGVRAVADSLGLGKSTVNNEIRRIAACFREAEITSEEQLRQVLDAIQAVPRAS